MLVGRSYDAFLDDIDVPFTPTTRRLMTHLLDETEEDYQGLINTLKQLGVVVKRPNRSDYKKGFGHRLNGAYLMTPRDDQIVIDNKIIMGQYHTTLGQGFLSALSDYEKAYLPDPAFKNIVCSSIVRLGEDIIVDDDINANTDLHASRLRKYFEPLGYNIIYTKTHDVKMKNNISHGDAVFAVLRPGLILHAESSSEYSEKIFGNWDYIKVDKDIKLTFRRTFSKI